MDIIVISLTMIQCLAPVFTKRKFLKGLFIIVIIKLLNFIKALNSQDSIKKIYIKRYVSWDVFEKFIIKNSFEHSYMVHSPRQL